MISKVPPIDKDVKILGGGCDEQFLKAARDFHLPSRLRVTAQQTAAPNTTAGQQHTALPTRLPRQAGLPRALFLPRFFCYLTYFVALSPFSFCENTST